MTGPPLVLEIKENSLDDGPGIRSVVFFKGCPLQCAWCHNPESQSTRAEISHDAASCLEDCDLCIRTCRRDAVARTNPDFVDRDRCDLCFECVALCPSGAMERVGVAMEVDEIVARVLRDKAFFRNSGGGVTLSGGEPTRHLEFAGRLARALVAHEIPVLLETCGLFPFDRFEAQVYPWLHTIYFDLKILEREAHRRWCGVPNDVILENFSRLQQRARGGGAALLPRVPLVPGITATETNLRAIAGFLRQRGVIEARLLPYNPLWVAKLAKIGGDTTAARPAALGRWMTRDEIRDCEAVFRDAGIAV